MRLFYILCLFEISTHPLASPCCSSIMSLIFSRLAKIRMVISHVLLLRLPSQSEACVLEFILDLSLVHIPFHFISSSVYFGAYGAGCAICVTKTCYKLFFVCLNSSSSLLEIYLLEYFLEDASKDLSA